MKRGNSFSDRVSKARAELRSRLNEPSNDREQRDLQRRIHLLDRVEHEEEQANKIMRPKIFVSFAGEDGREIMERVIPSLRRLKVPGTGESFHVNTGMMRDGKPDVVEHIIDKMNECCIFFGILTEEFTASDSGHSNSSVPGAWAMIEAGMALALGLNIIFFSHINIHRSFWFNPRGNFRHALFGQHNFEEALETAKRLVLEHYEEILKRGH